MGDRDPAGERNGDEGRAVTRLEAFSPMALHVRRATGPVVGRLYDRLGARALLAHLKGIGGTVPPEGSIPLPPGALRKTTSGKISRALNRAAFLQAGGEGAP